MPQASLFFVESGMTVFLGVVFKVHCFKEGTKKCRK